MKKLMVMVLSLVMMLAMSVTAFAASPSEDVIAALKNAGVAQEYINKASDFLAANPVSADESKALISKISEAKSIAGSVTDISKLSADQKKQLTAKVTEAAKVVNAEVTSISSKSVTVTKNGVAYTASTGASLVKATGVDTTATYAVLAVLAAAIVACGVVVGKKKFA